MTSAERPTQEVAPPIRAEDLGLVLYELGVDDLPLDQAQDLAERIFARLFEAEASRSAPPAAVTARPEVVAFAALMERVLRENDHKGGWGDCSPSWLLGRLRQEVDELDSAMRTGKVPHTGVDDRTSDIPADIAREAVDVANFAMMILDVLGLLSKITPAQPSARTAAGTPASEAYVQGHIDRYRRDRESDVLCRHCGKPWAVTPAQPSASSEGDGHAPEGNEGYCSCGQFFADRSALTWHVRDAASSDAEKPYEWCANPEHEHFPVVPGTSTHVHFDPPAKPTGSADEPLLRAALDVLNESRNPPDYPINGERWAGWVEGYDAARAALASAEPAEVDGDE